MPFKAIVFSVAAVVIAHVGCTSQNALKSESDTSPVTMKIGEWDVRVFRFGWFEPEGGGLITFQQHEDGYALTYTPRDISVCSGVYYVKTFGGIPPTVEVYLIDNRFVAYPETIEDSEMPDRMFNDMKAVTHVFDLESRQAVFTSKPYRYDHDIPLILTGFTRSREAR